ncbi:beta-alanyl-dopamine/carcinine hydrolase [Planococcus citri]|uniref:beta-alanyl-dopamine/carcinine hydrolase n=1 Tax=Planococcus citri TaxID=170843 RepID=UPI0031F8805F
MDIPLGRRNAIPILYTRGTHYDVGFDVGRTFKGIIQDYVQHNSQLNNEYIPLHETEKGKKVYEDILKCCNLNYPQYVREIQGTADGSDVPFYKLLLLHIGHIIPVVLGIDCGNENTCGCSSVCCNEPAQAILGHTEDAYADSLSHFYFVSAHIICDEPQGKWKVSEERFVSLCYAGHLPGFTMSYNYDGLVYSINVIYAKELFAPKTPEFFLCRALLTAKNVTDVENILKDKGCGSAEGFSVNVTFLDEPGERLFYNFEVGASTLSTDESILNKLVVKPGDYSFHCNKYLRLKVPEVGGLIVESSDSRQRVFDKYKAPKTKKEVIHLLSHQEEDNFTIFRDYNYNDPKAREPIATIAIGIFDLIKRTWSVYADKPEENEPMFILPLTTKRDK